MWKLLLTSYPCVQVIGLFGYLVKVSCENSFSLAIPAQVIGLYGYLVEILCEDRSLVVIPVQVIRLYGYLVIW